MRLELAPYIIIEDAIEVIASAARCLLITILDW